MLKHFGQKVNSKTNTLDKKSYIIIRKNRRFLDMSVKTLLWDVDGTIMNFEMAEAVAIRKGFKNKKIGICSDEMLADYSSINKKYWQALERGDMTKSQILIERFREFFSKYGIDTSIAEEFNADYQVDLGDTICFNDDAYELIKELDETYPQFAITNGTSIAQHKKLNQSGLDKIFKECYISDEIGYEKPSCEFFDYVVDRLNKILGPIDKSEMLIIGDSLTSDILGANNSGIKCCWYNPNGDVNDKGLRIDYEIRDLQQLKGILANN